MKIAIQGHPTRGKEVIQILKDLGGKGSLSNFGYNEKMYYWINSNNIILESLINIKTKKEFILYTLEEFEKEFPFKVGDKITFMGLDYPEVITKMTWMDNEIFYNFGDKSWYNTKALKKLKMKEERNITLTLDKAKEWYNKGGELKEIALQAFTEKELTKVDLPKTWKEFCDNYLVKKGECWLGIQDGINVCNNDLHPRYHKNWIPSKESAEAHLALIQLEQLRDCWRQGWKPTKHNTKYCIIKYPEKHLIMGFNFINFLSFPTKKMAEEFFECFRDLIEKAGDLI